MIIAVDFDGTIVRNNYPDIKGCTPYAHEVLNRLHAEGHYIIIWTCRTGELLLSAINFLLHEGIPFDRVNDHNPTNKAKYGDAGNKVYADVYIDDKNIGGFLGWLECEEIINVLNNKEQV